MKKLMIAAALVCAGTFANAAAITWGFGGKVYLRENAEATTATVGNNASAELLGKFAGTQLALVYLGQNQSEIDFAEILKSTQTGYTGDYKIVDTMDFGIVTSGNASKKGKWDPNNKNYTIASDYGAGATFGVAYFDGNEYLTALTTTDGTSIGAAYADQFVVLTQGMVEGKDAVPGLNLTGGTGNGVLTAADVPEPTSAMLLLLGVAGLALKRKRA